ncbi:MAG: GAF domain-containing protein, partial [Candidatus Omnitrophica bacterium]|nr:GAF domain-containing protein [Candidatus Omnitrophota bacterium]
GAFFRVGRTFFSLFPGHLAGSFILRIILSAQDDSAFGFEGRLSGFGPAALSFFQRRAETKFLAEQRRYQTTLRRASLGMGQIKNLKRLLSLIVNIVTKTVRLEHCSIYLFHEASNQYILKASKGRVAVNTVRSVLESDAALVATIKAVKEPIVLRQVLLSPRDAGAAVLAADLKSLDAAVAIPSYIEQRMLAIIVLGKKRSGKPYTQDDLVVFSILANQAALAIENAEFYEDIKKTHEQLFKAEKMATIGTMADGLSHQINNRLHAIGFIASDCLDTIRLKLAQGQNDYVTGICQEIDQALARIIDNVKRGGEIVSGLLRYTRKGPEGFSPVSFEKVLDASIDMAQFKIKKELVDIVPYLQPGLALVNGNFTQLQEVFFNMVDNAYDAILQRKSELNEENYKGKIEIFAVNKGPHIEVRVKDNGMGVMAENMGKLFTPFFTTKMMSRKGTGLGLYIVRQIIEENHHGKVKFNSEYQVGSETTVLLPSAI